MVLLYLRYNLHIGRRFVWMFHPLLRRRFHKEVLLDQKLLAGLSDKNPLIQGMKLGRFDKVLGLNRERINGIYRGQGPCVPLTAPAAPAVSPPLQQATPAWPPLPTG